MPDNENIGAMMPTGGMEDDWLDSLTGDDNTGSVDMNLNNQLTYDEILTGYSSGNIGGYLKDKFSIPEGHEYLQYIEKLDPTVIDDMIKQYGLGKKGLHKDYASSIHAIGEEIGTTHRNLMDTYNKIVGNTGFETSSRGLSFKESGEETLFEILQNKRFSKFDDLTTAKDKLTAAHDASVKAEKKGQVSDWYMQVADVDRKIQADKAAQSGGKK